VSLPLDIELRVHFLCHPFFARWDAAGLHLLPGRREVWLREQATQIAKELGLAHPSLPIEQMELVFRESMSHTRGAAARILGLPGSGLAFLSDRFIEVRDRRPVARLEHLLEFHETCTWYDVEQLAAWAVAWERHRKGFGSLSGVDCNWKRGVAPEAPYLRQVLARDKVDTHVHLGGVLGALELWLRLARRPLSGTQLAVLAKWTDSLGRPAFPRLVLVRLAQIPFLRELILLELRRVGALDTSSNAERLRDLTNRLYRMMTLERVLGRGLAGKPAEPFALALARQDRADARGWKSENEEETLSPEAWLRNERELLVQAFGALLGDFRPVMPWFGTVLSIYLVVRNLFQQAVTEQTGRLGFAAFQDVYGAATRWLTPHDEVDRGWILDKVTGAWQHRAEGRVRPSRAIVTTWIGAFEDVRPGPAFQLGADFGLVLHFIKRADPRDSQVPEAQPDPIRDALPLLRHRDLRKQVRREANKLDMLRSREADVGAGVVGIDAASQERDAGPEVFAPAFRFLRRALRDTGPAEPMQWARTQPPPLRATFHAGESFHHPVTGLRTIHEAINFLHLRRGDRIGHGLALGMNAIEWERHMGASPLLTSAELLDNLVWVAVLLRDTPPWHRHRDWLHRTIEKEYGRLFPDEPSPGSERLVELLFEAWRLRWMDPAELFAILSGLGWYCGLPPEIGHGGGRASRPTAVGSTRLFGYVNPCVDMTRCLPTASALDRSRCCARKERDWPHCPAVVSPGHSREAVEWRLSTVDLDSIFGGSTPVWSVRILWKHLFDRRTYRLGREPVRWPRKLALDTDVFDRLQEKVQAMVSAKGIAVEACPSSNRTIGGFSDLGQHPVFRLAPVGSPSGRDSRIRVTVNTDNPGIFCTTLDTEYLLLAHAATRKGMDGDAVERWIDELREQSVRTTFLRSRAPQKPGPTEPAWPPAIELHPEWKETRWYRFVRSEIRRREKKWGKSRLLRGGRGW